MYVVMQRTPDAAARGDGSGAVRLSAFDDAAEPIGEPTEVTAARLPGTVRELEARSPRWVWSDTRRWYPRLLDAGVRVDRCVDLRLSRRILRRSVLAQGGEVAASPAGAWERLAPPGEVASAASTLFDLGEPDRPGEQVEADAVDEWGRQRRTVAALAPDGAARLRLLLSAESAGALVAEELRAAGLPWRSDVHDQVLTAMLGPRPPEGQRPAELERLLAEIRAWLEDDSVNPDSAPELLRALNRAGLAVRSTRQWELRQQSHPVVAPLIEYKKRLRLWQANGWHWVDEWILDARFRPRYVVGGVVTGRWATDGGGAMQLPKELRPAVVADDGWLLVVADASQVEPRILAAMSGDLPMMRAGAAGDMYQAIVDTGAVDTRAQAKVGMLGALYGGTTGESGRMLPRLRKTFPMAIAYVEAAARAGERGEQVNTWLGRSSPQGGASSFAGGGEDAPPDADPELDDDADDRMGRRAMSDARAWGRFTRNFVVQGTAAEWAECWMASLRRRLNRLAPGAVWPGEAPHLVYFLHDEVVVHTPAALADAVAAEVVAAADEAGRLLFADRPVRFPLDVAVVRSFADAG